MRDRKAHARRLRDEERHLHIFMDGLPERRRKKKGAGNPLAPVLYGRIRVVSNIRSRNHYRERATIHNVKIEEDV